jgi:hypothetical protein
MGSAMTGMKPRARLYELMSVAHDNPEVLMRAMCGYYMHEQLFTDNSEKKVARCLFGTSWTPADILEPMSQGKLVSYRDYATIIRWMLSMSNLTPASGDLYMFCLEGNDERFVVFDKQLKNDHPQVYDLLARRGLFNTPPLLSVRDKSPLELLSTAPAKIARHAFPIDKQDMYKVSVLLMQSLLASAGVDFASNFKSLAAQMLGAFVSVYPPTPCK